ncbi:PAS domain S-box protein [Pedobacter changchengzhani]|uniref:histidine kinase n=1 Tax=Pedobacter changchengzhani TaxID=2529274 RepID=A0A4R5MLA9_9SPHI|nr:PAS domain-containing sensor histidine kinase [Pedobacter changchengzhani]TDG36480.1 PAS domain S-box protein [Pedobacter changchengzhani]
MENTVLLKAIIENAIDGLITIDDLGIVESINPSACKLFNYLPDEVLGHNISMLMAPQDRTRHERYLFNYKKTGNGSIINVGRELVGLKKNGSCFPFRIGLSEVKYSGRIIYAGFIHDLTKEKEAENKLQEYAALLEEQVEERTHSLRTSLDKLQKTQDELNLSLNKEKELGQLKSRFVSIASHEFRTPLSTIHLSASLIDRYAETLDRQGIEKHVVKIKDAVLNVTAILNDFLSLEKLDSGMVKPKLSTFSLSDTAKEIAEEMQVALRGNQEIVFKHRGPDLMIHLDQNLLKNCIIILIDNAIKYSGLDSKIHFYTKINEKNCTIKICDNGIGIPQTDHKHLFAAFFRAHNTGKISGNGLGLSILSRYTGLMNGKVSFQSRINKGTLFTLTFPQTYKS